MTSLCVGWRAVRDLPAESLPLVDALAESRLLTRDQRHDETVIEVAHEILLRKWDVLAGWLQDERAALKEADALERQSREWKENKFDESWLWGGQRLQDALALVGGRDSATGWTDAPSFWSVRGSSRRNAMRKNCASRPRNSTPLKS